MNHHPKKVMFSQNCQVIALYFPERLVFLYSPCVITGGFWNHEVVCEISKHVVFRSRLVNPIPIDIQVYLVRRRYDWTHQTSFTSGGMTGCVGNSHIVIEVWKKSCGSKGAHSLKCETQESLSQMLFLHQGRMFSFGNPLEIGPVFVYILCWWICKMFRCLFPRQELGFGLIILI